MARENVESVCIFKILPVTNNIRASYQQVGRSFIPSRYPRPLPDASHRPSRPQRVRVILIEDKQSAMKEISEFKVN